MAYRTLINGMVDADLIKRSNSPGSNACYQGQMDDICKKMQPMTEKLEATPSIRA